VFSLLIAILHSLCEIAVVAAFYFGNSMPAYEQFGFVQSVLLLSGLGYIAHSLVDFEIAYVIYRVLRKQRAFAALWNSGKETARSEKDAWEA
jgi:niacin transporter